MEPNLSSETIVKRVIDEKPYYIKVKWIDNEECADLFHLKILCEEYSWSGQYTQECAARYMKEHDESPEEYKENVKKVLTGNCTGFTCHFTRDQDDKISATFSWKKAYEGYGKAIVHGCVPVHLDSEPETTHKLIDSLIDANNKLQSNANNYAEMVTTLDNDLHKCREEMDKFIAMKTSLEMSLYEKFVNLLNSKKHRIEMLEQELKQNLVE